MRSGREHVLVVDRSGWHRYLNSNGTPRINPEAYDIAFLTTGSCPTEASDNTTLAARVESEAELWQRARAHAAARSVDHLVCLAEQHLLAAAAIRDDHGIPGPGLEATLPFRDKAVMKDRVRDSVPTPRYAIASDDNARDLLDRHHAAVLKPRRGAGSVDIMRVDSPLDLAADNFRDDLMFEEWIEGDIVHIDSVVNNGRVLAATVGRLIDPTTNFATNGQPVRGVALSDGPLLDRFLDFNKRVLEAMPAHTGITHLETFHTPDDEILFNEIGARPGGVGIVPNFAHRTGYDLYDLQIRTQLEIPLPEVIEISPELTGLLLVYAGPGRLLVAPQIPDEPWITFVDIYQPPDGLLDRPADISQAVLNVGVRGTSTAELLDRLELLREAAAATMRVHTSDSVPLT